MLWPDRAGDLQRKFASLIVPDNPTQVFISHVTQPSDIYTMSNRNGDVVIEKLVERWDAGLNVWHLKQCLYSLIVGSHCPSLLNVLNTAP
jgi:hypothetical protein